MGTDESNSLPRPRAKILMLHGNGQSGGYFHSKTRRIRDGLHQAFTTSISGKERPYFPEGLEFLYPDAPLPLPDNSSVEDSANHDDNFQSLLTLYDNYDARSSSRVWGYGDPASDELVGLELTFRYLLGIMRTEGPFIGVMGFSTGACLAAVLAGLLERKDGCDFQDEGLKTQHPQLQFAICFSGFKLTHPKFKSVYPSQISTPILHLAGIYDFWIPSSETNTLAETCANGKMIYFEGAHYVPRGEDAVTTVVNFIKESLNWDDEPAHMDDWVDI
ncbi:hypothetical protein N7532_000056 [Penicillium argentinense]|uniref:Serine hydrolase domain-containing protein n=1 Tax=Penicillium argentinense TaxID=1131581 RepID=A0A9W9G4T5_9EURO|nr:uncharacterized protein N7532_000056 [Penicillium argentinense]KAJ5112011.1 hypothetical protein N7532_000056 [Penicillium argentinense]